MEKVLSAQGQLLERERELSELQRAAGALTRGQGVPIVIAGPAGIGKTELLRQGLAFARERDASCAFARASEFERSFAFGVARQLLEPLIARVPEAERESLFGGAATLGRAALELGDARRSDGHYPTLHGLYWLCANLADRSPLMLAVDDIQWADTASVRWLSFLARRLDGLPVMLAVTLRTDEAVPAGSALEDFSMNRLAQTMRPGALGFEATAQLVNRALGNAPDERFTGACHEATRGNPLFLHELLGSLRERGVQPRSKEAAQIGEIGPKAVSRLVLHRLDGLGADARRAARAAALLGDGTAGALVRELTGLDARRHAEADRRLAMSDLVALEPTVDFAHPLSRAAVLASLSHGERGDLSRHAARALTERGDVEGAAGHLLSVPAEGSREVVALLRDAAARALKRGAPEVAVALLERSLAEPPPSDTRPWVMNELGLAELRTSAATAPGHLRAAFEAAAPGAMRAAIADDLARALHNVNRSQEAVEVAEAGLREVGAEHAELRDRLTARVVELSRFAPSREAVLRRIGPAVGALSEGPAGSRVLAVQAYDAMVQGKPAEGVAAGALRALRLGSLASDTSEGSMPAFLACLALARAGNPDAAGEALERAIATARRRGSIVSYTGALSVRARLRFARGDLSGAEADAREIDELGDEGLGRDFSRGTLIDTLVDQDRLDEAEVALHGSVLEGEVPALLALNPGLHARGRLRLAQGRRAEGLADVLACGRRQEAMGAPNPADVPWRGTAVLVLLDSDDRAEAVALSEEHLARAEAFGEPAALGLALRVRGSVLGGAEGLEMRARAVELLDASSARLELARALLDLGRDLYQEQSPAGARDSLRRARELADACGAVGLAREATAELVRAGGRPRRTRSRGQEALTPSEGRVATLASEDLSNREIAQALFVTEKTVEGHLAGVFRKLSIRSRAQLAAALRTPTS